MAKRKVPTVVVNDDFKGVSSLAAPENVVEDVTKVIKEDTYLSQSELDPNARWVSERLNDLLYKIHRNLLPQNAVNKLRAQLENGVFIK